MQFQIVTEWKREDNGIVEQSREATFPTREEAAIEYEKRSQSILGTDHYSPHGFVWRQCVAVTIEMVSTEGGFAGCYAWRGTREYEAEVDAYYSEPELDY